MRLKRWESPRRQGRNDKGKGGSARQRQLKKRQQMLRKKLQNSGEGEKTAQKDKLKIKSPSHYLSHSISVKPRKRKKLFLFYCVSSYARPHYIDVIGFPDQKLRLKEEFPSHEEVSWVRKLNSAKN